MLKDTTKMHRESSRGVKAKVAIITLSDTRSLESDVSGDVLEKAVRRMGHEIFRRYVIKDDAEELRSLVKELAPKADVIITNGGTGISSRDVTIEGLKRLLEKELPAFSALFAYESAKQVGGAALISRASAGMIGRCIVFCLPGSPRACELGAKLVVPELSHFVYQARN